MKKRLIAFIAFIACGQTVLPGVAVRAATGDHLWSDSYPMTSGYFGHAVDGIGGIAVVGNFFGTIDLGGGPLTPVHLFAGDMFLARYDAGGNHLWSRQFTPNGGQGIFYHQIAADPSGNIFVAGYLFFGSLDLGGGPIAGTQGFLACFDASGSHVWSFGYGDGETKCLVADGTHVVAVGNTPTTSTGVDFGGGPMTPAGGQDAFVAQLSTAGVHQWSSLYGNASDQIAHAVTMDGAGNITIAGATQGTLNFGGGPLTAVNLDLFLVSFTGFGTHRWSTFIDGSYVAAASSPTLSIAAGDDGKIAFAGWFDGSINLGGGSIASAGFRDVFLATFDNTGTHQWSYGFGSATGSERADAVSIDAVGNVLLSGNQPQSTNFGGGALAAPGMFVAVYDAAGAHLFSNSYSNIGNCYATFHPSNDMILFGKSAGPFDLGGGVLADGLYLGRLEGPASVPTSTVPANARHAALHAYPNPFNPTTTIAFTLEMAALVAITVHDARGRRVATPVDKRWHPAGHYAVSWSGAGASGVYFVVLDVAGRREMVKVIALK